MRKPNKVVVAWAQALSDAQLAIELEYLRGRCQSRGTQGTFRSSMLAAVEAESKRRQEVTR